MATKPLAGMPSASTLTGAELFYAQQAGRDVKVVASQLGANFLGSFLIVALPSSPQTGNTAYATNGLKMGETTGSGTGVPVYFQGVWRTFSSDLPVQS